MATWWRVQKTLVANLGKFETNILTLLLTFVAHGPLYGFSILLNLKYQLKNVKNVNFANCHSNQCHSNHRPL